jgi:RimJ/RimL family protein N-acetyltransferase
LSWFQKYEQHDNDFVFVIEAKRDSGMLPVGQSSLYNVDWDKRIAEFGRLMIGEPGFSGKGLAKQASILTMRIAFEYWQMNEVVTFILTKNERSIRVCHSVGFEDAESDGRITKMIFSRSKFFDSYN